MASGEIFDPLDPHAKPVASLNSEEAYRDLVTVGALAQADGATDPVDTSPLADLEEGLVDDVEGGGRL